MKTINILHYYLSYQKVNSWITNNIFIFWTRIHLVHCESEESFLPVSLTPSLAARNLSELNYVDAYLFLLFGK